MAFELWGGVECTVNRVGTCYHNQLKRSGHWDRPEDIDRFAELRISALRYPFLWELLSPTRTTSQAQWGWAEERLARMARKGIRPIAGLLHHGSGPSWTHLCDPDFPNWFADYAFAFARHFPWVTDYTPINEPLTTARFSGLYGLWYPHGKSNAAFIQALIHQCRAIVLAMRAIRMVNPDARLIQTEDLGTISSTPGLTYQADFENHRRWLSLDLLCGCVDEKHPLRDMLLGGTTEQALDFFLSHPCPPDIIGLNYYITSDRFLDDRLERYPPELYGGNGIDRYVDISCVHALEGEIMGHEQCLRLAWERYRRPVALTEVHINSTREDQLRWLKEGWEGAWRAQAHGADVRGLTVWSLLGSFDWNILVTAEAGFYEPGVFDVRSPAPRPTSLGKMMKSLAEEGQYDHPVLEASGWWRRECRTQKDRTLYDGGVKCEYGQHVGRPILITGATGTLGRAFARACEARGLSYRLLSRQQLDIADHASVERVCDELNPWAIINTAGYVRVDDAEVQSEMCFRENTEGPQNLALVSEKRKIPLITFSSDMVFNGETQNPYLETDTVAPLNVYGQSKAEAERKVLALCSRALVIRTSSFFGPWDAHNFLTQSLRTWMAGFPISAAHDIVVTPTYVPDLITATLDLLIDEETGIWHLANPDALSWADFAGRLAALTGFSPDLIKRADMASLGYLARRPKWSALGSSRGLLLPGLTDCLERYVRESEILVNANFR